MLTKEESLNCAVGNVGALSEAYCPFPTIQRSLVPRDDNRRGVFVSKKSSTYPLFVIRRRRNLTPHFGKMHLLRRLLSFNHNPRSLVPRDHKAKSFLFNYLQQYSTPNSQSFNYFQPPFNSSFSPSPLPLQPANPQQRQ